jgi:hypothetical protein
MAGNQNSGGYRPTAPQNNPANISATGGNGQSGKQPMRYMSGQPYGQGQATMQQQAGAPMYQAPVPEDQLTGRGKHNLPQLRDLMSPTENPMEPTSAGVDFGRGPGSEVLPNVSANTRPAENQQIVNKYMPALLQAAQLPDAPDSYKRFVNFLIGQ